MNHQIDDAVIYLENLGVEDPEEEFRRKHQIRRMPARFDEHAENVAEFEIKNFFRRKFYSFLDVTITEYGENLARAFKTLQPLFTVLKAPLTVPESIGNIQSILNFFPQPCTIDPHKFMSEFSNFVVHTQMNNKVLFFVLCLLFDPIPKQASWKWTH